MAEFEQKKPTIRAMHYESGLATILVIEDNPGDVLLLKRAFGLSSVKVDILVARDGDEGLQILGDRLASDSAAIDLVLLDINMPGLNGFEVLQYIRAHESMKMLPVIVLTASRLESDVENSVDFGATSFITKGSDLSETLAMVRNIAECWLPSAAA